MKNTVYTKEHLKIKALAEKNNKINREKLPFAERLVNSLGDLKIK